MIFLEPQDNHKIGAEDFGNHYLEDLRFPGGCYQLMLTIKLLLLLGYTTWTPPTGTHCHPPCGFPPLLLLIMAVPAVGRLTGFYHVSCEDLAHNMELASGHTNHTVPHFLLPDCGSPQTHTGTLICKEFLQ